MIKNIYIAGPLFNVHERRYLEEIVQVLEKNGYQCFLPHRDQSGINEADLKTTELSASIKEKIFKNDLNALKKSDMTVALNEADDWTTPKTEVHDKIHAHVTIIL